MSQDRWDPPYHEGARPPWDLGAPNPVVMRLADARLAPGSRLLVPGCGLGHEVIALADRGHRVIGLDVSPTALERLRRALGEHPEVTTAFGDWRRFPDDLEASPASGQPELDAPLTAGFDAVVEHTCYCALDPGDLDAYAAAAARALPPGGLLLGAFLHFDGGGPPWGTSPEALRARFAPRFEILRLEPAPEPFPPAEAAQLEVVLRRRGEPGGD